MLTRNRLSVVVTLFLLLSMGCSLPGLDGLIGTSTAAPSSMPGLEALPLLPPTLVESIPVPGEEMPVDGSITLYFDQPMDPEATEDAISLDPTVEGRFEWPDDQTLRFEPREPLERATTYLLTISTGAMSQAGLALDEPIRLPVTTIGPLLVAQVSPSPGSTDVDPAAVLTVVFNRPVVPLQVTGDTPEPLELEPDVPGHGEWIDTGIYLFYPDPALPGGATVRARVGAGLTDLTGASLDETFEWTFTTSLPQIITLSPERQDQGVARDATVEIGFNQTMDTESVESAFTLRDEGSNTVAGAFSWNESATEVTFTPDSLFPYAASYVLELGDSARATSEARLTTSLQTTFRSVPEPSVVSSNPRQVGTLRTYGSVEVSFSAPMDEASLLEALSITPEVENIRYGSYYSDDRSIWVDGDFAPSSTYTLTLADTAADPYGTTLREPFSLTFHTTALSPFVRFQRYTYTLSLTPTSAPQVEVNVRNVRRLDLELYEIPPDDIFWMAQDWRPFSGAYNPPGDLIRSWSETVSPPQDVSQVVTLQLQSTPLPAGLYFLTLDSPNDGEAQIGRLLLVRQIELVLKFSASQSLVWAVDLSTGEPAAGLSVELLDTSGRPFASGTTDEEGIWIGEYPTRTGGQRWEEVYAASGSPEEGYFGLTSSAWTEGLESYEFGIGMSLWPEEYTANLYTDRPIYRPGQPVRFRGVLRQTDDARYALPDLESVAVTVYDEWTGQSVYQEDLALSDFGTFDGEFTLDSSANGSYYAISTDYGSVTFTVAEYRRPDFTVSVEPSETDVAAGDPLTALISAEYYFGGAVADAVVQWRAWGQSYYPPAVPVAIDWFGDISEAGFYGERFGDLLAEGEGETGPDGTLVIDVPTTLEGDRPIRVIIEATLTERSGLPVTGRGAFALHPALVYFGVRPVRYAVRAGEEALVEIQATDWAGERVAGRSVEVLFERVSWRQVVTPDGGIDWESTSEFVDASTVRTTTEGPVTVGFVPDRPGTYRVTASGNDRMGRLATGRATIWVSGPGSVVWRQRLPGQMILVPDREAYEPGQTARVLVPSPFDVPVPALVSIERGSVLRRWVTTIGGDQSEVEIPISIDDAPNVYLSVVLIRPSSEDHSASIAAGLVELPVSAQSFELNVTLTPDRTTAGPGEQVTYLLKATDAAGRPVQAEFSLGLADLAALSLAEPNSVDLFDEFYSRARLGVLTAASLSNSSEGLTAAPEEEGGRGGGGGEGEPPEVRGEFPDTAFWDASIVTDADGRASVTLTLPDSLTTWRMDARGTTVDTLVGQTTVDLIATRDLLIRPVTPRFFTAGDSATVAGVVHNNTDQDLPVEVWLVATGAAIDEQVRQSLTVPAGGQVRVDWGLVVEDVPGVALTFHVSGGGLQDASRPTIGSAHDGVLPVLRYSAPDTVATAGALDEAGSRIEVINLPRRFDPSQGELRVNLEPSLGSAMNTALQELEDYPYGCTEQVVSRFLPNLAVYIALRELGLEEPELQARLERTLAASLEILRSRQMDDGSWGWWTNPPGDVYLTTYVLYGFLRAGEAGFEADEDAIDRAATFLRYRVRGPTPEDAGTDDSDRQAFLLYVLTLAGNPNTSVARRMVDYRENMSPWGQSLLALALHNMDPDDEAIPGLLADLNTTVIRSATGAHWEDEGVQRSGMISSVSTTAQALRAVLALEPENPLAADSVRWLLAARLTDGSWRSTHDGAWALLALSDWVRHAGGLRADYDFSVDLNGLRVSEGTAIPGAIPAPVTLTTPIAELDATLPNQLAVRRGPGNGLLTYTAHLSVYRPVEDVEAVSRGLMVSREYSHYDGECGATDNPCPLATSVAAGEDVLVRVTLVVPSDQYYLVLEDPYPAGMDPINTRLETSPTFGIPSDFNLVDPLRGGWGWWYFTRSELGDDHLALFADHLPAGTYQYAYVLHATLPGEYRVLPTRAWAFYFPEVYGHGDGRVLTIQP